MTVRAVWIAAVFLTGSIASRLLARLTPPSFAVDLAQPLAVATSWGGFGAISLALVIAMLGATFVPYLMLLRRPPPVRVTIAAAACAMLAGMLFKPVFSSDVYAYAAYGEMARTGLNPYAHFGLPLADPVFRAALWQWPQLPVCVYGEGFVALARALATIFARAPVVVELNSFRICAMAAHLSGIALAAFAAGSNVRARRFAAAFLGCNPLVLWSAIEGHNDAIMIAVALAAVAIARRPAMALAVAALAASVKLPATAVVAALTVRLRARAGARLGLTAACSIVAISYARWADGVRSSLAPHGSYDPHASTAALIWLLTRQAAAARPILPVAITVLLVAAAGIAFVVLSKPLTGANRYLAAACALWIAVPNPYPWYGSWILAMAAFAEDARLRNLALAIAGLALLRYVPDAAGPPSTLVDAAMGLAATAPYVVTFALRKRAIISRSL